MEPIVLRRLLVALLVVVVGLGSAPVAIHSISTDAQAQTTSDEKPTLFQRIMKKLRGGRTGSNSGDRSGRQTPPRETPIATVEILPKEPDARKVLVIGDFIAGGLAWGLEQAFADEPKLVVIDKSNANSGLVRVDYYDWTAVLLDTLNAVQPDLIVLVFGANDRQNIRVDSEPAEIRSEAWAAAYSKRITGLIETLKVYGRPFFWVGTPPMRVDSVSSDMAYLNTLFKPPVKNGGGHFVDIWDGFANEDGRFVASGPDVEGQVRQLRTGEGVNFTRAGRLKLAFYVEREIRRQTGFGSGGVDLLATVTQGNQIEIGPDGSLRLVGPIISLNDPLPGSSHELAGSEVASVSVVESPQFKAIVRGEALPEVAGRVDDHSWPPRKVELVLPVVPPEPVTDATFVPIPVPRPDID
jgi:uncharacterized protein